MLGSIKKALIAAGVVAACAVAPAVASANQWTDGGAQFNGPAHVAGTLSTSTGSGATSTCDITATVQLANTGVAPLGIANGAVSSIAVSNCSTNVPNCAQTVAFSALPWTVTTSGSSITTSGIQYTTGFSGAACSLNGVAVATSGAVTGDSVAGANVVEYNAAPGLTTSLGPILLNGQLEVFAEDGTGGPDYGRPIELT